MTGTHLATTADFYDRNGGAYYNNTVNIDMGAIYSRFLKHLNLPSAILDAGSGSGRDTKAFLDLGYDVDAFDASETLANLSSRFTGRKTQVMRFQDFTSAKKYDGIWCCAALLHVPRSELKDALSRLIDALKPNGVMYVSFKSGETDRVSEDGRHFTDLSDNGLAEMLKSIDHKVDVVDLWYSSGESGSQQPSVWLNAILQKIAEEKETN